MWPGLDAAEMMMKVLGTYHSPPQVPDKVDHIWSLCYQLKPDSRPSMGEVLSDHGVVALQTQQGVGIFVLHY